MRYVSTRGLAGSASFTDVLLQGLCSDGGLFMPESASLPSWSQAQLERWARLPYPQLAFEVTYPFVRAGVAADVYQDILERTWRAFAHSEGVIPLRHLTDGLYVLELFHGPSFAFKDYALQCLGHLFAYVLERQKTNVMVLGATSGDTGAAAIVACLPHKRLRLSILHPHKRIASRQRRQMTTIRSPRLLNIAIEGVFDDCQSIVKRLFAERGFLEPMRLVAVNSVNWARLMTQIVYYVHSCLRIPNWQEGVSFCVPTGNFGNVFAGYMAKKMGLPIRRLLIASNHNDVLPRLFATGCLQVGATRSSLSPSMDIQIASNFERMLYEVSGQKSSQTKDLMHQLQQKASVQLSDSMLAALRQHFSAVRIDDDETMRTIRTIKQTHDYFIDPHTAVGIAAASKTEALRPMICLATAHAAKFPAVVLEACGTQPPDPSLFLEQQQKKECYMTCDSDGDSVKNLILKYFKN